MIKIRKDVKIGGFALLMLFALYWGINFLKGRDIFSGSYTYYAVYDQANGLKKSSSIFVRGVKVGVINDIRFDPRSSDDIVFELTIKKKYRIPVDSKARVFSDGILGGKAIEIVMGTSDIYLESGSTMLSESDKDFLDIAGGEFEQIKQKANILFKDVTDMLENINSLLAENSDNIAATVGNLASLTGNLNNVVASQREELKGIITNINGIVTAFNATTGRIDTIVSNVQEFSGSLAQTDVVSMAATLTSTLEEINGMIARVNNGDGTVGRLLGDESLFDSLNETAENLAALLQDLKENPGRYVHFSVFGRKNK